MDLHHAKCVFGNLIMVTEDQVSKDDVDNHDFLKMYTDLKNEEGQAPNEHHIDGFCACKNGHILGIIKKGKYYFVYVSQIQILFQLLSECFCFLSNQLYMIFSNNVVVDVKNILI